MISTENKISLGTDFFDALIRALSSGKSGLKRIPDIVFNILRDELWKVHTDPLGNIHEHKTFEDYVTAPPLQGLGEDMESLKALCAKDNKVLSMIDEACQGEHGGLHNPDGKNQHKKEVNLYNIQVDQNTSKAPTGTSKEAGLRRLRKESKTNEKIKQLYEKALAGEISVHRAMVEAGFRKVQTHYDMAVKAIKKLSDDEFKKLYEEVIENRIAKQKG